MHRRTKTCTKEETSKFQQYFFFFFYKKSVFNLGKKRKCYRIKNNNTLIVELSSNFHVFHIFCPSVLVSQPWQDRKRDYLLPKVKQVRAESPIGALHFRYLLIFYCLVYYFIIISKELYTYKCSYHCMIPLCTRVVTEILEIMQKRRKINHLNKEETVTGYTKLCLATKST